MPRRTPGLHPLPILIALALAGVLLACVPARGSAAESATGSPPSSSSPSSVAPAALQELMHEMGELRPSTIRVTLSLSLQGKDPTAPGGTISVVMRHILAEVGIEPPTATVTTSGEAGAREKVRLVNGEVYVYVPYVARFDGRRPWIRMSEARYERDDAAQVGVALAQHTDPHVDPYASVIAEIEGSKDFRELGPSTVDGQAVTGFAMTPAPTSSQTPQSGMSAKQEAEMQAAARRLGKSTSTLEVFIAANGLPVRTRTTITLGPISTLASVDVTATDFPLVVLAPPARETISFRALRKIETKLTPPVER